MGLFGRLFILLLIVAPILVRLGLVDRGGVITGFVDLETRAAAGVASLVEQSITLVEQSTRRLG